MTNPNKSQLYERVVNMLSGTPSEQPVVKASIGPIGKNDQSKANSKDGITSGHKSKQKGNPNKSYSVHAINRAVAKLA